MQTKQISDHKQANDLIDAIIRSGRPSLIGRFGGFEQNAVMWSRKYDVNRRDYDEVLPESSDGSLPDVMLKTLNFNAGVFPKTPATMQEYCDRTFELYRHVDVLGYFTAGTFPGGTVARDRDFLLDATSDECKLVSQVVITAPYKQEYPWTRALRNKKVLIIHPFVASIARQYEHRTQLFYNYPCRVCMPEFEMRLYPPVQSSAGMHGERSDWFGALESMNKDLDDLDFDVALIGAGAYGMHLAKHCKDMGKIGICMASGVQMAFGVYGGRWIMDADFMLKRITPRWVRPMPIERGNLEHIEYGCYI